MSYNPLKAGLGWERCLKNMKLLFVCTGNTCRSSMAESLARQVALELGLEGWEFRSAGTCAVEGSRASANSLAVLREMGLDLSGHQATPLSRESVAGADLILGMTEMHKGQVLYLLPASEGKVFTLLEFATNERQDIADPFGGDIGVYRQAALQLHRAVKSLISKLAERNRETM